MAPSFLEVSRFFVRYVLSLFVLGFCFRLRNVDIGVEKIRRNTRSDCIGIDIAVWENKSFWKFLKIMNHLFQKPDAGRRNLLTFDSSRALYVSESRTLSITPGSRSRRIIFSANIKFPLSLSLLYFYSSTSSFALISGG